MRPKPYVSGMVMCIDAQVFTQLIFFFYQKL